MQTMDILSYIIVSITAILAGKHCCSALWLPSASSSEEDTSVNTRDISDNGEVACHGVPQALTDVFQHILLYKYQGDVAKLKKLGEELHIDPTSSDEIFVKGCQISGQFLISHILALPSHASDSLL